MHKSTRYIFPRKFLTNKLQTWDYAQVDSRHKALEFSVQSPDNWLTGDATIEFPQNSVWSQMFGRTSYVGNLWYTRNAPVSFTFKDFGPVTIEQSAKLC